MFERKSNFKSYFFTFLGGLVTGAALGLLYAPITGKKMQKKVTGVTNQVIDKVDQIIEKADDFRQTVRKFASA